MIESQKVSDNKTAEKIIANRKNAQKMNNRAKKSPVPQMQVYCYVGWLLATPVPSNSMSLEIHKFIVVIAVKT